MKLQSRHLLHQVIHHQVSCFCSYDRKEEIEQEELVNISALRDDADVSLLDEEEEEEEEKEEEEGTVEEEQSSKLKVQTSTGRRDDFWLAEQRQKNEQR